MRQIKKVGYDIDDLRRTFSYCPETGVISAASTGRAYSSSSKSGYVYVTYKRKAALAHRIIWAIFYGEETNYEIDHINGARSDNRIVNLRAVTSQQNRFNCSIGTRNKSGVKGVIWEKSRNRWRSCVIVSGVHRIARFKCFDDAKVWAERMRAELHGEHAKHG